MRNKILFSEDGTVLKWFGDESSVCYEVPDGVRVIGEGAFADNEVIERVTLPGSVTEIGKEAFRGCSRLSEINLKGVLCIGDSAFEECVRLREIVLPEGLEEIGDRAFYDSAVRRFIVPRSVKTAGSDAFKNVGGVRLVDVYESTILRGFKDGVSSDLIIRSEEDGRIIFKSDFIGNMFDYLDFYHPKTCGRPTELFNFEEYDDVILSRRVSLFFDLELKAVLDRLRYPYRLSEVTTKDYIEMLRKRAYGTLFGVFSENDTEMLGLFLDNGFITESNIFSMIERASYHKRTEFVAFLLDYKNRNFPDLREDTSLE